MAAKHSFGNIGKFNATVENWDAYLEWMEQYFVANEVTSDAKKKAILLSTCNASLMNQTYFFSFYIWAGKKESGATP